MHNTIIIQCSSTSFCIYTKGLAKYLSSFFFHSALSAITIISLVVDFPSIRSRLNSVLALSHDFHFVLFIRLSFSFSVTGTNFRLFLRSILNTYAFSPWIFCTVLHDVYPQTDWHICSGDAVILTNWSASRRLTVPSYIKIMLHAASMLKMYVVVLDDSLVFKLQKALGVTPVCIACVRETVTCLNKHLHRNVINHKHKSNTH